jgi:phosphoribosylanthranilate isomerase
MPTEIKICGLSDPESVDAALEAGADFLGFVFFPRSPRNLTIEQAAPLMRRARGKAQLVALLVDPDADLLDDVAGYLAPDLIQLHGRESPDRVAEISADTGIAVMKAVGVAERSDLAALARYAAAARLLLDAKPPRYSTRPGGNGAAFDWSLLRGFAHAQPWLLSGGLNPANVAEAIQETGAKGVDVSSGVERAPGNKDPALIRRFIAAVRAAEKGDTRLAG